MALVRNPDGTVKKDSNGHPIAYVSEAQALHKKAWDTRRRAQKEARIAREEAAAKRSPEKQIRRLNDLFGVDKGAKKERAKLVLRIGKRDGKTKTNASKKEETPRVRKRNSKKKKKKE